MSPNSPQLEEGFIQIATGSEQNDFLLALTKLRISGTAFQCMLLIIRKTWGFKKKEDWISLTQFQHYTGRTRKAIVLALNELVQKNTLVKKTTLGVRSSYQVNKDFSTWKYTSVKNYTGVKKGTQLVYKITHTKENITKEKEINKEKANTLLTDEMLMSEKKPPIEKQFLCYEDWYRIAKLTGVKIEDVIRKYYEMRRLIETNQFKKPNGKAYGKDLNLTLQKWLRMAREKGTVRKMNEFEIMTFPYFAPGQARANDMIKSVEKAHAEGRL